MQGITIQKGLTNGSIGELRSSGKGNVNSDLSGVNDITKPDGKSSDVTARAEISQLPNQDAQTGIQSSSDSAETLAKAEKLSVSISSDEKGVALEVRDNISQRLVLRFPIPSAIEVHDVGEYGGLLDRLL